MKFLPRLFASVVLLFTFALSHEIAAQPIDREALVRRHNPVLRAIDPRSPLSVGNGQFAFTVDVTGLQSLQDHYSSARHPLDTLARWAWHTEPNPQGYTLADASEVIDTHGRPVAYPNQQSSPAGDWLRKNPHDHPLGQIGFVEANGAALKPADISNIEQTLDLWRGEIRSRFKWRGVPVDVSTVAHPRRDGIAVQVRSPALAEGKLRVEIAFPRGHDLSVKNTPPLDWSRPETHETIVGLSGFGMSNEPGAPQIESGTVSLQRRRDQFSYATVVAWRGGKFSAASGAHRFHLTPGRNIAELELSVAFVPPLTGSGERLHAWALTREFAAEHWANFWRSGGAIDFSGSTDPLARELERRVVLSQYLTASQFGGQFPPQETGLTVSSWYGKHHTEMVWWHTAHFAQWGREEFLANALKWYVKTLPAARALAKERGLTGARWPKMIGPEGRESPGGNPFIVWNQPHPIYLAELLYRANPDAETLASWRELVLESAEAIAAMLHFDAARGHYVLGPPLWIAQEIHDPKKSQNPGYELAYWRFGLEVAQQWRERLGLARSAAWDERLAKLSPLPHKDGKYVALESIPDTWENRDSRHDHPSFLMSLGQLPGAGVDRAMMRRTLDAVLSSWDWETKIWGWDYPMIAMTAARLGAPEIAVDVLMKSDGPHNEYLANGHCPGRKGDLAVYLPANGALLSAVGLMAGGWDGAPEGAAPGFPKNGKWQLRVEGLRPLP